MKKLLILILIALLLALVFIIGINGVNIGSVNILGIKEIQAKNIELDNKIQSAGKLAQSDFKKVTSDVDEKATELEKVKQKYVDLLPGTEGENQTIPTLKKYEIETLWVKIGNHATAEGVTIKMDVVKGNSAIQPEVQNNVKNKATNTSSYYDLKFTANGSYIAITDFISDIENDDELGFKIDEFKLVPSSGSELQATFVCRDIAINIDEVTPITTDNTVNSTNNVNTLNMTNTVNNTTNSTNTNGNVTNTQK